MTAGGRRHRRSVRRSGHIRTAATEAGETAAGRMALVVAAAPIGVTTYDADGDRCHCCCPRGAATADVMMTMAGKRGGEATARQWRGDGDGDKATTRQQGCEGNRQWCRRWQGQRGNRQEESNNINITNNQTLALTHLFCLISA